MRSVECGVRNEKSRGTRSQDVDFAQMASMLFITFVPRPIPRSPFQILHFIILVLHPAVSRFRRSADRLEEMKRDRRVISPDSRAAVR